MSDTPPKLADLRDEIDALDDALLDLLERRMTVATKVAQLKGDDGLLKLRPKREGAIVARLAGKARIASKALIAHVWRELMAHSRQSQARMEVRLFAPNHAVALREAARERFGRVTPIVAAKSPQAALAAAAAGEVVALIELGGEPWWRALPAGVVPFGVLGDADRRAVMVGRMAPDDISDEDRAAIAEVVR
ncbi:MAG: chorismate mutase [Sphingomicrobium sp.]